MGRISSYVEDTIVNGEELLLVTDTDGTTKNMEVDTLEAYLRANLNTNPFVANLTGNVTGNVTGDVTGDLTGNVNGANVNTLIATNISAIATNTAKTGITTGQANAIVANTAKTGITSGESTKLGHISVSQAVNLDTMESDIGTKVSKTGNETIAGAKTFSSTIQGSISGSSVSGGEIESTYSLALPTQTQVPSGSSSTGKVGEILFDQDYVYICIQANTWKRSALSSF